MPSFMQFRVLPLLARLTILFIGATSKIKIAEENTLTGLKKNNKGIIFAFWHGHQFMPVYYYRNKNCWTMTSKSRDGELQTKIIEGLGYRTVRGSSTKDGASALASLLKNAGSEADYAAAVDGPRGPYHEVKPGIFYVAQKTGKPILPLGVAVRDRHVFSKSWDKYIFPRPFTKCVILCGNPVWVDGKMEVEQISNILKSAIDDATQKAEQILNS